MPYIPDNQRAELDPHIEALAQALNRLRDEADGDYEGFLNYTVTTLILKVLPERRYKHIARITGALENVKQEFYRRFGAPYEDEAISKHGDVF